MKTANKMRLALAMALVVVAGFTFCFMQAPVITEVVVQGGSNASLTDNITEVLEDWLPILIILAVMSIGLKYLGISLKP